MPDLSPTTALGASTPRFAQIGALTLTENTGLALASLTLRRDTVQPVPMGLRLPGPGGWTGGNGVSAFWTAPGQWFIEAEGRADGDFAGEIARVVKGCSVTEQTDGWVAYEIESAEGAAPILALMEKTVNIDTAGFGPGRATRTALEHLGVHIVRRADDHLAVFGMRSAAESLWHALETAARDIATPVCA